tara:strand:+ start:842 stop:1144 length:303 start_codon:yes stop_codon:yes gene_type:complete
MGRSRRLSGKLTTKQIDSKVDNLIDAVSADLARINGLLYGLLKEFDLLEETACGACGQVLFQPLLKAIPKDTTCPKCGSNVAPEGQMTIDQWDNGKTEEE